MSSDRKHYEKPTLTVVGTVDELTAGSSGSRVDQGQQAARPGPKTGG